MRERDRFGAPKLRWASVGRGREHEQHEHDQRRGSEHPERVEVALGAAREAAAAALNVAGFSPGATFCIKFSKLKNVVA